MDSESEAAKKARASIPRPSSTGHRFATTFSEQDALAILAVVPSPPAKSAAWLAEILNEATIDFLASYAINHPSRPSEQAHWNRELKRAADACLTMIAPGFSEEYPPRRPVPEVYATLFHNGGPEGIKRAHLQWLGFQDEHAALDRIADAIWLLRTFAANAEERWREQTAAPDDRARRPVRKWFLTWVSDLGRYYAQTFGELPSYTTGGPFSRFANAARVRALAARDEVTDSGLDQEAYAELAQFDEGRLAAFTKAHIEILRPRWRQGLEGEIQPVRFKYGIAAEIDHTGNDGD